MSDYESVAVRSDQAIIGNADLLHCLQVAVWRAGLLDAATLARLKDVLGISEDESVPKPPPQR